MATTAPSVVPESLTTISASPRDYSKVMFIFSFDNCRHLDFLVEFDSTHRPNRITADLWLMVQKTDLGAEVGTEISDVLKKTYNIDQALVEKVSIDFFTAYIKKEEAQCLKKGNRVSYIHRFVNCEDEKNFIQNTERQSFGVVKRVFHFGRGERGYNKLEVESEWTNDIRFLPKSYRKSFLSVDVTPGDNDRLNRNLHRYIDVFFKQNPEFFKPMKEQSSRSPYLRMVHVIRSKGIFKTAKDFINIDVKEHPTKRFAVLLEFSGMVYYNKFTNDIWCTWMDMILLKEKRKSGIVPRLSFMARLALVESAASQSRNFETCECLQSHLSKTPPTIKKRKFQTLE